MWRNSLGRYFLFLLAAFSAKVSLASNGATYRFVENKGQWDHTVQYKVQIPGGDLYVLKDGLKYVLYENDSKGHQELSGEVHLRNSESKRKKRLLQAVNLKFDNCKSAPTIYGEDAQSGSINFFKGDKSSWVQGVRAFSAITIEGIYSGVDFQMYSSNGMLKYDFIVAPGTDPSIIKIKYEGQTDLNIVDGRIVFNTLHGQIIENRPVSYSGFNARRQAVASEYEMDGDKIGFKFPNGYDRQEQLVIDPELIFSTYSGSFADNWGFTATYDDDGNLYSGGIVSGVGFPTTTGVFQQQHQGEWDIGILKYDPTGKDLIWATYLGGSYSETPQSIIVNSKGELIIYGTTSSPDFPMTSNSFNSTFLGGDPIYDTTGVQPRLVGGISMVNGTDIFLAKLSTEGDMLNGSTFIGGTENDGIMEKFFPLTRNYGDQFRGEVIVDEDDNIFVASNTSSADFLIKGGAQSVYGGGSNDGVMMKFNEDLSDLIWSTYVGGIGMDALFAVKVDQNGNVFGSGGSTSIDFPTTIGAIKTEKPQPTDIDGVVVKLSDNGTTLLNSTYLGTSSYDQVYFLELDSSNHVYVLGQTQGNYPVTDDVYANANSGQFIHKLGNDLDTTYFSTVIGSGSRSPDFSPTAFLVNECENIFVSGWGGFLNDNSFGYIGGNTFGLPISDNAFQNQTDGTDFYLMVLLQDSKQLLYGTYFGEAGGRGEHVDGGTSRFDKKGIVYQSVCGGCGGSSGFPTFPSDVWSRTNNSSNCNNAAFKFDLATLLAKFETDTEDFTNRGIRKGCYPLTLNFLNESIGGENFQWDFGEGTITDQEDSILITYDNPGVYPVVLTATDINTCIRESTATGEITVFDYDFDIMPDDSICFGEDIQLKATGGILYEWRPSNSLNNPNIATPTAQPDTTTTYAVKIEDANGCSNEDSLTIKVVPQIIADFSFEKMNSCHDTPQINFTNNSINASGYNWDFGDGNFSEEKEPSHQYAHTDSIKTYQVSLTAGESFCSNSLVTEVTSVTTFVPNFISPNGDGKNDAFEIFVDDSIELNIFNRWGKAIYENKSYQNTWSPSELSSGVYYYEIIFDDQVTRCNGWLQVMH